MPGSHRIIIDTNLWIHFLLSKQFAFLDKLLVKKVKLIFSEELLFFYISGKAGILNGLDYGM
jgi:predicted nucleic acid-binding protein